MDYLENLAEFKKSFKLVLVINDLVRGWKEVYPRLNIREQMVSAHNWLLANKAKAPKELPRFLNSWMRTADSFARSSYVYTEKPKQVPTLPPQPDLSQEDKDMMHRQLIQALGSRMCKEAHCKVCGKP